MDEQFTLLKTPNNILSSNVLVTEIDNDIFKRFDFTFDGSSVFEVPHLPEIKNDFEVGVIFGSSGSGKTSLLKQFGDEENLIWNKNKSVASHFENVDDAIERLTAVGLNTVPTWSKPRHVLSNGEGFRCDLARRLRSNIVIDEFTSVVNRDVAKSCSFSLAKYIKRKKIKNVVLATCHEDILDWLQPSWVFDTDAKKFASRRSLRPSIEIKVIKGDRSYWDVFKKHHYLNEDLPFAVECFLAVWENKIIGFSSSTPLPGKTPPLYEGDVRKKWRECRTVVLPDFQGLGIGTRFSDMVADIHIEKQIRYFSKTSHVRMGFYREKSDLWRATATNLKDRSKSTKGEYVKKGYAHIPLERNRICYSHEYIGTNKKSYNPKYNLVKSSQQQLF